MLALLNMCHIKVVLFPWLNFDVEDCISAMDGVRAKKYLGLVQIAMCKLTMMINDD